MRDRFVELVSKAREKCNLTSCCDCEYRDSETLTNCYSYLIADYIVENGGIAPRCKVGDTVWFELYGQIESAVIYHCTCELSRKGCFLSGAYAKDTRGLELSFNENSIGKTVFLTREETEQALKGG